MGEYLGREILKIDDTVYEVVDVPEWKGKVRVKSLSGTERDAYETSMINVSSKKLSYNLKNMGARLVALSMVDEDGKKVFNDKDVIKLGKMSGVALKRVYEVCARISGLENEAAKQALENLAITPDVDLTSN